MTAAAGDRFVDNYLGYLLGQANHALYKDFDAQVRARGLSSIEWRVLATLHDSPPLTVSQLALEVLSKQPTVTKLVQRMAEQGWVSLQADPADQRRTLVSATAAVFECFNRSRYLEGDHVIFVGEVESCTRRAGAQPLIFHGGRYFTELPL